MGICSRSGLGKLRHIDTQCLWLQQKVRSGAVELRKVKGTENPADLFTKHLTSAPRIEALLKLFGCEYREGRAASAPELRQGEGTQAGNQLNVAERAWERGQAEDRRVVELVTVDGHEFPRVLWDGETVPEAWSYDQKTLPHLQAAEQDLFPRATAASEAGDEDPAEHCSLEQRWREIIDNKLNVVEKTAGEAAVSDSVEPNVGFLRESALRV